MANLSVQHADVTGTTLAFAAASAGGDRVTAGAGIYVIVRNGGASAVTVTLATPGTVFNGQQIPDTTISVGAGASVIVPVNRNYRSDDGLADITYSDVTSVTVAALAA